MHRFYGRFMRDHDYLNALDWAYQTYPGFNTNGPIRDNISGIADWIYTPSGRTMFDFSVALQQYTDGFRGLCCPSSSRPTWGCRLTWTKKRERSTLFPT